MRPYADQEDRWGTSGKRLNALYDEKHIVVYQAYKPSIGQFAAEHGYFGGPDWLPSRMTWVKPNWTWMMHRCQFASARGQEVVLAVLVQREFFEECLWEMVPSSAGQASSGWDSKEAWQEALKMSDVRVQWDPDYNLLDKKQTRRALQMGMRKSWSVRYASGEHLGGILDITEYCKEQAALIAGTSEDVVASVVKTPWEREYPLPAALRVRLGMESEDSGASGSTI